MIQIDSDMPDNCVECRLSIWDEEGYVCPFSGIPALNIGRQVDCPLIQPELDEWCTDCKEYDSERHCCPRYNRVILETLKDVQTEIIRCLDCKYYDTYECMGYNSFYGLKDDDYCSWAERKEEHEND